MIRALVLTGYGINCEKEMAHAWKLAGAEPTLGHVHALMNHTLSLDDFHILAIPGGFSFGDELGAGKAFANRLSYRAELKQEMERFVDSGRCILGICNGFQLLVKLGLLPGLGSQKISLASNQQGRFINRWSHHKVFNSPCIFTQNLKQLYLPVRHGEGRLVFNDESTHKHLIDNNQIVFRYSLPEGTPTQEYPHNPNGSCDAIAGICDQTGRILGMMAHPEAALTPYHHPQWTRLRPAEGEGLKIFDNAVSYLKESL